MKNQKLVSDGNISYFLFMLQILHLNEKATEVIINRISDVKIIFFRYFLN